ncbi:MAG: LysR family transcriptional regulator [Alphaproteobacteria bacterium]|nr:LysR family transcriptional regulator [Alphaproteobacteria bacterium]
MARPRKLKKQRPQVRILFGSVYPLGPGKASLIEAVGRTGSISAAARELGMSYRRAWQLIDATNKYFRQPLVETATGGRGGGGATVTSFGEEVLDRFRTIEAKAVASVDRDITEFERYLADEPSG